jgi:hypothetical protein
MYCRPIRHWEMFTDDSPSKSFVFDYVLWINSCPIVAWLNSPSIRCKIYLDTEPLGGPMDKLSLGHCYLRP